MTKARTDIIHGNPVPQDFFDSLQEFVSTMNGNFVLSLANATTVQVVAGAGPNQVSVGIGGPFRYRTSTITATHPGGAAGTYDIYVVASANAFVPGTPEVDNTDYTFGLQIVAGGAAAPTGTYNAKAIAHTRLVGTLTWSGSAITALYPKGGAPSPVYPSDDVIARQGATTQALLGSVAGAAGISLGLAGDVTLVRSATGPKAVHNTPVDATGYQVSGVALAASHLSNGVSGSGAVALAVSPALTGTPTAPTPTAGDSTTKLATTAFVAAADIANPGNVPVGAVVDWPYAAASIPSNYLLPYGQAISRAAYPALHALAAAAGYPNGVGDGSTTFNLPDYRGRSGVGKDDMGGTAAGRVTSPETGVAGATLGAAGGTQSLALTSGQIPAHTHALTGAPTKTGTVTLSGAPALSGTVSNGTLAVGTGTLAIPNHLHAVSDPGHNHALNDPGHSHTVTNPTHTHGVSDPTHAHSINDPGHVHSKGYGGNINAGNGSYMILKDDYWGEASVSAAVTGIGIYGAATGISLVAASAGVSMAAAVTGQTLNGAYTGLTVGNPTTLPAVTGAPALSGAVGNGSLAVTAGTLAVADTIAVTAGSLAISNTGGGTTHPILQPSIIVNKMMRVA